MTYAEESDIEATTGYTIDTNSIPTSTQLANMLTRADSLINAEMKTSTNITDTYGYLKEVACSIVYKMILKMWHLKNPEDYAPVDVELTEKQMRKIHMAHRKWTALTFSTRD